MSRLAKILAGSVLLACAFASTAQAEFGLKEFDVSFRDENGALSMQAGSHPFAWSTELAVNTALDGEGNESPDGGEVKSLRIDFPPGVVGTPNPVPPCSDAQFIAIDAGASTCRRSSMIGKASIAASFKAFSGGIGFLPEIPVYNLNPPPGVAAKLGFVVLGLPVTIETEVNPDPPHNLIARSTNIAQAAMFYASKITIWGVPADPAHDADRGGPVTLPEIPFITLPRSCQGPLETVFRAVSWTNPAAWPDIGMWAKSTATIAEGTRACERLDFAPELDAQPTSTSADSPSGMVVEMQSGEEGLLNPKGIADSDIEEIEVTFPKGMTINPSQAEGLATCSEAQLARETAASEPGEGCSQASKVGTIEIENPLLPGELLRGSVFVATPHDNLADDSLIAIYVVVKSRKLGIVIRQAGKVAPDPRTGQIVSTFEDMPQLPLGHVTLRLREGGRSPLVTPPSCGTHTTVAELTPYADPSRPLERISQFEITSGPGGAPCPPAGAPPFEPGFEAGTLSNAAGSHSPFAMRLTRRDGDQDMTRFDAVLPPGVTAKLAGVPWCPEAAIARARGREGKDELARPSCPLASQIGSVQGGAGVGSQLTYVPGRVYLAGPVGGAPISVVGIVPAVAGPFDVGTIVVRQALGLDPITGQARVLSAASDPLPHILAGIPLRVRDIQVSVDRPNFTLNPTNCAPMATLAGIWGGGSNVFSSADDFPVLRSARFQAAGCRGLGFKPRLAIKLKGGVRRGAHPALRAHVRPRPGEANFSRAVVTLPRSAFLDQAHIRTICTRVQFAAGPGHGALCPKGARYGFARAWSPLLDGPVTGPVYLRSSDNRLPDLVAALTGPPSARVQVELSARIDSVKGGIRSTFAGIPDLPVSRFILDMQGGKKGLIVNSRHLCHKPARNRARANLRGQNGARSLTRPVVRAVACGKKRKAKRARVSAARAAER